MQYTPSTAASSPSWIVPRQDGTTWYVRLASSTCPPSFGRDRHGTHLLEHVGQPLIACNPSHEKYLGRRDLWFETRESLPDDLSPPLRSLLTTLQEIHRRYRPSGGLVAAHAAPLRGTYFALVDVTPDALYFKVGESSKGGGGIRDRWSAHRAKFPYFWPLAAFQTISAYTAEQRFLVRHKKHRVDAYVTRTIKSGVVMETTFTEILRLPAEEASLDMVKQWLTDLKQYSEEDHARVVREVNQELQDENRRIMARLDALNDENSKFRARFDSLVQKMDAISRENENLRKENEELRARLDATEER